MREVQGEISDDEFSIIEDEQADEDDRLDETSGNLLNGIDLGIITPEADERLKNSQSLINSIK
jgi:hypothetical protein